VVSEYRDFVLCVLRLKGRFFKEQEKNRRGQAKNPLINVNNVKKTLCVEPCFQYKDFETKYHAGKATINDNEHILPLTRFTFRFVTQGEFV